MPKTPPPPERQCKAMSKRSKERCRRYVLTGYDVCIMHGAGTKKRLTQPAPDGRIRKDPATAALKTGLYTQFSRHPLRDKVAAMEAEPGQLYNLNQMAARAWALLLSADELEASIDWSALTPQPPPTYVEDIEDAKERLAAEIEWNRNETTRVINLSRDVAQRLMVTKGAIQTLYDAIRVQQRLNDRAGPTITKDQLAVTLRVFVLMVHELALDPTIPREEIAPRVLPRMLAEPEAP